ncbi:MAG: hypothetical protein JW776_13840 [Candidatus Lokiarchaeota archaeon]|nr:hypothetical protein [Candidatus Lokiarchaeota archaeon]
MIKQNKRHPLIEKVLSLVEFDPMYENMGLPEMKVLYLSDESRRMVQTEFEKYFNGDEIIGAIAALLELANALDGEGHTQIAVTLVEIVVSATEPLKERKKSKKSENS